MPLYFDSLFFFLFVVVINLCFFFFLSSLCRSRGDPKWAGGLFLEGGNSPFPNLCGVDFLAVDCTKGVGACEILCAGGYSTGVL